MVELKEQQIQWMQNRGLWFNEILNIPDIPINSMHNSKEYENPIIITCICEWSEYTQIWFEVVGSTMSDYYELKQFFELTTPIYK